MQSVIRPVEVYDVIDVQASLAHSNLQTVTWIPSPSILVVDLGMAEINM